MFNQRESGKMVAPNKRELQAQERRNQLLDTARRLFAAKGVENTTIKDIADEAGVAQGLLYHYFRGKDDLFWAIIGRDNPFPMMSDVFMRAGDRPEDEVMVEAGLRIYALLAERSETFRIVARELTTRAEIQQGFIVARSMALGVITGYLETRIAAGKLRPHNPDVTARMLMGSIAAGYLLGMPTEAYVREVVGTLLRGVAAE
ncbi:MAG TPA: helix-turn-helix domain-containing protein [Ktedonobacterales bacterium]|nr:helix-turn-helix domain-containing protein [Ktedonobacterales bacterium]